jgi:predicted RNase H-like nuclease
LFATWRRIADAVEREVRGARALLPMTRLSTLPLARLKGVEDALDAIVCAWIGAEVMRGRAQPYGDETAAIWVPAGRGASIRASSRKRRFRKRERRG